MNLTKPTVDIEKVATEIKKFMDVKKFDSVDYSYTNIEVYPPPESDDYPEIKLFSKIWSDFFKEADKVLMDSAEEPGNVTFKEVLDKYSPELATALNDLDEITAKVAEAVNSDRKFWDNLREIVLPLYERNAYYEDWKKRWNSIALAYDPTPLEAKTTQMWTNKETGERIRGDVVSSTVYPAGFVVKIL